MAAELDRAMRLACNAPLVAMAASVKVDACGAYKLLLQLVTICNLVLVEECWLIL